LDVDKTMLDELTRDCKTPQDMEKLYSQMLQHMINRSLEAEMQAHLGHERYGRSSGNVRNGKSRKRVQSAMRDLLFLLPPEFADPAAGDGMFYCPACAEIRGLLAHRPPSGHALDVRVVDFPRPRAEVAALLGSRIPVARCWCWRMPAAHRPESKSAPRAPACGI
jgi:hypothetical protein